jgi:hypothetical protein
MSHWKQAIENNASRGALNGPVGNVKGIGEIEEISISQEGSNVYNIAFQVWRNIKGLSEEQVNAHLQEMGIRDNGWI